MDLNRMSETINRLGTSFP